MHACTHSQFVIDYRLVEPSRSRVRLPAPTTRIASVSVRDWLHTDKIDFMQLTTTSRGTGL